MSPDPRSHNALKHGGYANPGARGPRIGDTISKRQLVLSTKKLPPSVRSLCGNPPVLSSERRSDYESLFGYMADCVKPTDVIEWLWLKDVVDHTWEIRRLRRFKRQLIEDGLPENEFSEVWETYFADFARLQRKGHCQKGLAGCSSLRRQL